MYHQFKELADVDITKEAMEVGPTCHYIMGGVRVDADTRRPRVPGLFAAGEVAAGCTARTASAATRCPTCSCSAAAPASHAAELREVAHGRREDWIACRSRRRPPRSPPFDSKGNENPYAIHADLQECMQSLVGIIRTEGELKKALEEIAALKQRLTRVKVEGGRAFNPGWHLALDLHSMLSVSEATTLGAIERKESRGGHTRDDYPFTDDRWGTVNVVLARKSGAFTVKQEPIPPMPDELKALLKEAK